MAKQESSQYQPPQGPPPSNEAIELLLDILRRINKEVEVPALEGSALKVAEFYQKLVADLAPGSVEPDRGSSTICSRALGRRDTQPRSRSRGARPCCSSILAFWIVRLGR
jgi:hypothetical protein